MKFFKTSNWTFIKFQNRKFSMLIFVGIWNFTHSIDLLSNSKISNIRFVFFLFVNFQKFDLTLSNFITFFKTKIPNIILKLNLYSRSKSKIFDLCFVEFRNCQINFWVFDEFQNRKFFIKLLFLRALLKLNLKSKTFNWNFSRIFMFQIFDLFLKTFKTSNIRWNFFETKISNI